MVAIIAIVVGGGVLSSVVSIIGKAFGRPVPPPALPKDSSQAGSVEQESSRAAIEALSERLERLEEERDFYKDLLDSPSRPREIRPPNTEEDASDAAGGS